MPAIQTSFARPVPAAEGRIPSSSVMPGVLRYMRTMPPEKAPSTKPARRLGINGIKRVKPTQISALLRSLPNLTGSMSSTWGKAFAAICCSPAALSASRPRLFRPELRMYAPVTSRRGIWLSFMEVPSQTFATEPTTVPGRCARAIQ